MKPERADRRTQPAEQLRYARLLDWGTRIGLVVLVAELRRLHAGLTTAARAAGAAARPVEPAGGRYLQRTRHTAGWGWLALVQHRRRRRPRGHRPAGRLLAACLLALVPLYLRAATGPSPRSAPGRSGRDGAGRFGRADGRTLTPWPVLLAPPAGHRAHRIRQRRRARWPSPWRAAAACRWPPCCHCRATPSSRSSRRSCAERPTRRPRAKPASPARPGAGAGVALELRRAPRRRTLCARSSTRRASARPT